MAQSTETFWFAKLSIAAAVTTILLKVLAYALTNSVGLLSDALESVVNLLSGLIAFWMLKVSACEADEKHAYGHTKAEYFSSLAEGTLILLAAIGIIYSGAARLVNPQPITSLSTGCVISAFASVINFGVAMALSRAARKYNSITLQADAQHLLTDVWTSAGVLVGVSAAAYWHESRLDPGIAILVGIQILFTGWKLLSTSINGLMDTTLPREEQTIIMTIMEQFSVRQINFHALRTRQAASTRFMSVHMLFPGNITLYDAHQSAEEFETAVKDALGGISITTHLEPIEDDRSHHRSGA